MTRAGRGISTSTLAAVVGAVACLLAFPQSAAAQKTVDVTVPAGVSFLVRDVSASTAGSPATTQITWAKPKNFVKADALRISAKADAAAFSGPGSTHPAATRVSWTASASSGTASSGTLSSSTYGEVFLSPTNLKASDSGTVNVSWTLGSIAAAGLRSGAHTLTVRWKFEVF